MEQKTVLTIPIRKLTIGLAFIALALCSLSIALKAYEWSLGVNNTYWVYELNGLFSTNQEGNVPTYFSALLLLSAALTAATISRITQTHPRTWGLLALVLLYMSIDEAASIHEMFTDPLRDAYNLEGYLHFGWVLVGVPVALLIGALFLPFVLKLPAPVRLRLIAGGALYLFGAVVVESISANEWYRFGGPSLLFSTIGAVEEFFEMCGVIIALNGLLHALRLQAIQIGIQVEA